MEYCIMISDIRQKNSWQGSDFSFHVICKFIQLIFVLFISSYTVGWLVSWFTWSLFFFFILSFRPSVLLAMACLRLLYFFLIFTTGEALVYSDFNVEWNILNPFLALWSANKLCKSISLWHWWIFLSYSIREIYELKYVLHLWLCCQLLLHGLWHMIFIKRIPDKGVISVFILFANILFIKVVVVLAFLVGLFIRL